MAILKRLFPNLAKPAPTWVAWGLIAVLAFACASFYVRARDIGRGLSHSKLYEWMKLRNQLETGDKLALIQIAGHLAGNEGSGFLEHAISEMVEGVDPKSNPQQLAVDIAENFSQLKFDAGNRKFMRKNQIVTEENVNASTQTRPADSATP